MILKLKKINQNKIDRIYNEDVFDIVKQKKCFLAGGIFRTLINEDEEIVDYDIFFYSKDDVQEVRNHFKDRGHEEVFVCPLGHLYTYKKDGIKVQLITKFDYKRIQQCIYSFDFHACAGGYDGEYFYIHKTMIRDVKTKLLTIQSITFPVATMNRIYKYRDKGYNIFAAMTDFVLMVNEQDINPDNMELYID